MTVEPRYFNIAVRGDGTDESQFSFLGDLWPQYNSHHRRGLDPFANLFRFKGCDEEALQQHKREDIEVIEELITMKN
jgi:hypothetical protein